MNEFLKPKQCCEIGSFDCQVAMPINGKVQCIDYCISHIVAALNAGGIKTLASCCGHGKFPAQITIEDRDSTVMFLMSHDKVIPENCYHK